MTLVGMIFSKGFVYLFAFGFHNNQEQIELTNNLTFYMFPYVGMICIVALFGAYLQCFRKFAALSASPILLNLSMIVGMIIFMDWFSLPIYCLALGVILGGILQVLLMVFALKYNKIWSNPSFSFNNNAMNHFKKLLLPGLFGTVVYQLNVF
jgi:putative peptidoglycan lipid II flippase